MLEENRDHLTGDGFSDAEPEEVVSWYTPRSPEGEEVVQVYVQDQPLPERAIPRTPPKKHKKRRGVWIFLACVGVMLAVVVIAALVRHGSQGGAADDEDGNASSIVQTDEVETSIPTIRGDSNVQLEIQPTGSVPLAPQEIYEKVNPSTVTVVAEAGEEGEGASIGTGVIMTSDGYIITNAHVISGGKSCWIALDNGVTYDVKLVGYDEQQDLAVLKVVDDVELPAAEFGDSMNARVGDTVYAIGNPLGLELRGTMTNGMLSAVGRSMDMNGGTASMLQTTAALNSGNSGGPLINEAGQVIGINTMKMSNTDLEKEATVEGLGFALPISEAKVVIDELIAKGEFSGMPVLGITVVAVTIEGVGDRVMVQTVNEHSGAQDAGVQAGDLILAIDGAEVDHIDDLLSFRRDNRVGDSVTLTLQREDKIFDVNVVLFSDREIK